MTGKQRFYELVDEGRKGHNVGLSVGSDKLLYYMDGWLPGTSYLIGGASGTGKSTYALHKCIYSPLMDFLNGNMPERDPHWILFNLEMTQPQIYAKLVSMYIFDKFGVQLKFKEIFSRGKETILSDEHYEILQQCNDFMDILDERLICHDDPINEARFIKFLSEDLSRFGKFQDGKYYPNNPLQIVGMLLDHMSLVKASPGRSKKEEIDAISHACVQYRNKTGILSPVLISQFNRSSSSDERLKQDVQEPTMSDFKDSGSLYEDSQVVIALYSPHKYRKTSFHKYNIKILEQSFIAAFLLKTRFGGSDMIFPTGFYGDCSQYYDLPRPDEILDFTKYTDPYWTIKQDNEINLDEKKEFDIHV